MRIHIEDIPAEGLELKLQPADNWFHQLALEAFNGRLTMEAPLEAVLHLTRSERTVTIDGEIHATLQGTCDRCNEAYREEARIPVEQYLIPHSPREERTVGAEEVQLNEEDVSFSTYKPPYVELDPILREQIVLEEPIQHLCRPDCRGLCPHCGVNLNQQSCDCHEEHTSSPFAVLKSISLKS